MIRQSTFYIPREIEAGLRRGDLTRYGGIVRNQNGHIVAHLREVLQPRAEAKLVKRVAAAAKNPRILIPTVVGGALTVVAVRASNRTPRCVANYNASLRTYLQAVREGRLDATIIDRLLADLDAVLVSSDEAGTITLDFSTAEVAQLVQLVVGSTHQLAEENSTDLGELEPPPPDADASPAIVLRHHLELQRRIFAEAA